MTLEEAQTVARIIGEADGGCTVCVGHLADQLNRANLGFVWTPTEDYRADFNALIVHTAPGIFQDKDED